MSKNYLKEWYNTGTVGDGEEVVTSQMPDSFRQMRASTPEPVPKDCPPDSNAEVGIEVEIEKEAEPEVDQEPPVEIKNLKDVYIKTGVFFDALHQYRDAVGRGDEAMQTEYIKERLKSLSVEIMRLVDGI